MTTATNDTAARTRIGDWNFNRLSLMPYVGRPEMIQQLIANAMSQTRTLTWEELKAHAAEDLRQLQADVIRVIERLAEHDKTAAGQAP